MTTARTLIAGRFEIRGVAGKGGMAEVYRTFDRQTRTEAAVKVVRGATRDNAERFTLEARLLAQLHHPAIVGYLAHGTTDDGLYLAMEWLEGEDLSARLLRETLSVDETLTLGRCVAEALAAAHARAVVHRDLKPSNLFLPRGRIDQVKVLDFGIARWAFATNVLTHTGSFVGTPAYMAPEQTQGRNVIDGRADLFSLGCVLFQCLSGRPPFFADHLIALLAKVMFEEAPRVRELRPDLPPALDDLVARLLAKDPAARPRDAAAVVEELNEVARDSEVTSERVPSLARLTSSEQQLVCVALASEANSDTRLDLAPDELSPPPTMEPRRATAAELREVVERHGGEYRQLADGTVIALLAGGSIATDLAIHAARCALALRSLVPTARVALATGRAAMTDRLPVGEAIDRAARLVTRNQSAFVQVDELSAGLLDARFEVVAEDGALELRGERAAVDSMRTLLGRQTSCVGRTKELAALSAVYTDCANEGVSQVALVTGPAGAGKSRIRHEFLRTLAQRDDPPEVWIARGDPMSAGAPFGLLAQALRRALGTPDGEPSETRQMRLRSRVFRHAQAEQVPRICEFLGEIVGIPFSDEGRVQLKAARQDPQLMGDQMGRAWEDFLDCELRAHPVVLVLEDLHWGDWPTLRLLGNALRNLPERRFMVLAFARPEVHELFPSMFLVHPTTEIRLPPLSARAAGQLVREALGAVDPATLHGLVNHAQGNPFFLEELIRAHAQGRHEFPATMLATVQARLGDIEPVARRVLRAASVFGEAFWQSGVEALVGPSEKSIVRSALQRLVDSEVVTLRSETRFGGELEYVFRQGLVREAAYAMLTADDLQLGHRLAGEWLEGVGETEAAILARHFALGNRHDRAVAYYLKAAAHAFEGNDLAASLDRVDQGIQCGARGEALGGLRMIEAEVHNWRAEFSAAARSAATAMRELSVGSASWYVAAAQAIETAGQRGDIESLVTLLPQIESPVADPARDRARILALVRAAGFLLYWGRTGPCDRLLAGLDWRSYDGDQPELAARILAAHGARAVFEGDVARFLELVPAAVVRYEHAGDFRNVCMLHGSTGHCLIETGAYDDAEGTLLEVLAASEKMGLSDITATARQNLALTHAHRGAFKEARELVSTAVEAFRASENRRMEAVSLHQRAKILQLGGDLSAAEADARKAVALAAQGPSLLPIEARARAVLSSILLAGGRAHEAISDANRAVCLLQEMRGVDGGEALIRLVWAEALQRCGLTSEAQRAIRKAAMRIRERASKIGDERLLQCFLEEVTEHRRTLSLEQLWRADEEVS